MTQIRTLTSTPCPIRESESMSLVAGLYRGMMIL